VGIGEETSWVGLDLRNLEDSSSVNWGVGASNVDAGGERTLQATLRLSELIVTDWVGEGDSWWTAKTLSGLVNVGGSLCWALVCTGDTLENDVLNGC
jgi:hypothetical protein